MELKSRLVSDVYGVMAILVYTSNRYNESVLVDDNKSMVYTRDVHRESVLAILLPSWKAPGLSDFLRLVTFQILWALATTNCGGRRP